MSGVGGGLGVGEQAGIKPSKEVVHVVRRAAESVMMGQLDAAVLPLKEPVPALGTAGPGSATGW